MTGWRNHGGGERNQFRTHFRNVLLFFSFTRHGKRDGEKLERPKKLPNHLLIVSTTLLFSLLSFSLCFISVLSRECAPLLIFLLDAVPERNVSGNSLWSGKKFSSSSSTWLASRQLFFPTEMLCKMCFRKDTNYPSLVTSFTAEDIFANNESVLITTAQWTKSWRTTF